ncbi:MAG: HTH domain-containing protein [Bacteroidales bacterium]|nr:HTH domain-containing protein [Bacteroidales bacterium]
MTAKEISDLLGKTTRTIERNLKILREKGIIIREGSDKSGQWIIKN